MYAVNVLASLSKSLSTKIKGPVFLLNLIRHNSYKTKPVTSLNVRSKVADDVTLFHFENPKYFLIINFSSAIQCAFWTYLGLFLQELKKSSFNLDSQQFWAKIVQKEREYSDVLSLTAVIFGWTVFAGTLLYSFRSIRKIILHKGGNYVTIVTYNLPGFNSLKVPLNNVSSFQHRSKAKKFIPIKIKNKYFYYLIDVKGKFSDPTLFDFTAGLKRTF